MSEWVSAWVSVSVCVCIPPHRIVTVQLQLLYLVVSMAVALTRYRKRLIPSIGKIQYHLSTATAILCSYKNTTQHIRYSFSHSYMRFIDAGGTWKWNVFRTTIHTVDDRETETGFCVCVLDAWQKSNSRVLFVHMQSRESESEQANDRTRGRQIWTAKYYICKIINCNVPMMALSYINGFATHLDKSTGQIYKVESVWNKV